MSIPLPRRGLTAVAVAVLLATGSPARAGLMTFHAVPFTGDLAAATVTFDDGVSPGSVRVTVTVDPSPSVGDINGFFLNVGNESLLPGLAVTGADVTLLVKAANAVTSAGPGNNVNGEGVGPFDVGVRIGSPGVGEDDIQSTSFVLSHGGVALTNELFAGATTGDGDLFALRLTSVGPAGSSRNGSSKLTVAGPPPNPNEEPPPPNPNEEPPPAQTPEPSTLLGLGTLGALGLLARRAAVSRPSSRA
jgi:hypothetical protein